MFRFQHYGFPRKPKISKLAPLIKKNIAILMNINLTQISLKATTTEKLGIIRNNKGIVVQAVCNILI